MKKDIVIKKNKAQRVGIRVLAILGILAAMILMVYLKQGMVLLLCLPFLLILGMLLCYYETWQIGLGSDIVYKKIFFLKCGTYSYSQIKDVMKSRSYTEHEYVCISFVNGKRFQFRSEDENADKAIKQICKRHSIRMV